MPRQTKTDFQEILEAAFEGVVRRLSAQIVAAARDVGRRKGLSGKGAASRGGSGSRGAPRPVEITAWTTDRRARRVPNFVIEMTGLDTKKKIVAKFGENVTFHRGQPLPPAKQAPAPVAAQPTRTTSARPAEHVATSAIAKPPRIRKVAGTKQAVRPVVAKPPRIRKVGAA